MLVEEMVIQRSTDLGHILGNDSVQPMAFCPKQIVMPFDDSQQYVELRWAETSHRYIPEWASDAAVIPGCLCFLSFSFCLGMVMILFDEG